MTNKNSNKYLKFHTRNSMTLFACSSPGEVWGLMGLVRRGQPGQKPFKITSNWRNPSVSSSDVSFISNPMPSEDIHLSAAKQRKKHTRMNKRKALCFVLFCFVFVFNIFFVMFWFFFVLFFCFCFVFVFLFFYFVFCCFSSDLVINEKKIYYHEAKKICLQQFGNLWAETKQRDMLTGHSCCHQIPFWYQQSYAK